MDFLAFGAAVLTIDPWSLRLIGRIRKDLRPLFQPRATRANGRPDRGWIHTVVALSHLPDRFQAVLSASVTMVALALIGDALGIADADVLGGVGVCLLLAWFYFISATVARRGGPPRREQNTDRPTLHN